VKPFEKPLLIIDSLNLFTRHFIANPTISQNGDHVGGVVGFLKAVQLLSERFSPSSIYVVWEGGGSPRRRAIQASYKNLRRPQKLNRFYSDDEIPDTVENRNWQIATLIKLLNKASVRQFYVADCEADDIIGYMCQDVFPSRKKIVISSDKDLYQLITKNTLQWSPGQKKLIDAEAVKERFGIYPENFCLVRSFVGDASDNLQGIKGAGFKSVVKRFPEINQRSLLIDDLIKIAEEKNQDSKLKIYSEIARNPDVPRNNWKLMNLGVRNLSAFQIQKINFALESGNDKKRDKLGFIREQNTIGINNFDIERFFLAIRNTK
jgi:DNA polymerase-1